MGLTPVPDDHVAAVVTVLEMHERPRPTPLAPSPLRLVPWRTPAAEAYRALFRRVGAPWLWYSRLELDDEALTALLGDPAVQVHAAVDPAGVEVGMLELAHRTPDLCELSYFALVPELVGRGNGRWLMAHALALGWRPGVERMRVSTCTLDHPRALPFYRAAGFRPLFRVLETCPDPRVAGLLPADAAPQVPCLSGPAASSR